MAEPESILQLGIEAARENKKEEARQLFRLLTRQEPDNVQGWLWLAGVAENREERQTCLEHVLELEPDNEMAQKGLQALGVRPAVVPPPIIAPVAPPNPSTPPPSRADTMEDDPFGDDPFAELDNLSDVMASDTAGPVRRIDPVGSDVTAANANTAADAAVVGAAAASSAAASADRASRNADRAARNTDRPPRNTPPPPRGGRNSARYVEDDELEPPRRGLSPLLGLLLFLVGLGLIGLLIFTLFGGERVAGGDPGATAAALTAEAGLAPTSGTLGQGTGATTDPAVGGTTTDPAAGGTTTDPAAGGTTTDPAAGGTTTDPAAGGTTTDPAAGGAPVAPAADVSGANPAIIQANTPIQSENWVYDFPQATYAASIIGNLGQYTPNNGRFVVVLVHAINNAGSPQPVPGNFFVVKDAQGRVWEARPEVSDAYVVPGVNADQTHNTPIAPDGNYRSVALVFDVAPDATDLVLFARSNPAQGWIILRSV